MKQAKTSKADILRALREKKAEQKVIPKRTTKKQKPKK